MPFCVADSFEQLLIVWVRVWTMKNEQMNIKHSHKTQRQDPIHIRTCFKNELKKSRKDVCIVLKPRVSSTLLNTVSWNELWTLENLCNFDSLRQKELEQLSFWIERRSRITYHWGRESNDPSEQVPWAFFPTFLWKMILQREKTTLTWQEIRTTQIRELFSHAGSASFTSLVKLTNCWCPSTKIEYKKQISNACLDDLLEQLSVIEAWFQRCWKLTKNRSATLVVVGLSKRDPEGDKQFGWTSCCGCSTSKTCYTMLLTSSQSEHAYWGSR